MDYRRHVIWLFGGLWLLLHCSALNAQEFEMQTTSREAYAVFGREVRLNYSAGEQSAVLKVRRVGDTVVSQVNGMGSTMLYDWNPNYARFGFSTSGTTNSNLGNGPVDINGSAKSETWEWALGSFDTGAKGTFEVTIPGCVAHVTFGNGGASRQFKLDTLDIYIDGNNVHMQDPYAPAEPEGKELYLLLDNQTGAEQKIMWGNTMLTLKPGVNQIRYDGPVDANGLPTVSPLDFHGTVFNANGNSYLSSTLSPTGDDKIFNYVAPNIPSSGGAGGGTSNPSADTVEVLSKGDGVTRGDTIAIHHPGGGTTITTLPASPKQSGSNTSGGGAVLSDPTKPKPGQNAGNTTTNSTTNNTTNNSTVNNHSTTIINNESDKTDDGPPSGYTSPNLGNIETEAKNQAGQIQGEMGRVTDKASSLGGRLKFWNTPSEISGRDVSWAKTTMTIADKQVNVEIEARWLDLIRTALLWVVKIIFVYSVIKLFMR